MADRWFAQRSGIAQNEASISPPSHTPTTMHRRTVLLSLVSLPFALPACSNAPASVKLEGRTMGTRYHIQYQPQADTAESSKVQAQIDAALLTVNQVMSTYDPESELSRLNRNTSNDWINLSPALYQVFSAALEISRASGGVYDISVGPLVNVWGFGPGKIIDQPPSEAEIAAAKARVGYEKLELRANPPALRKQRPDMYLDLSSIAKGYGVDQVALLLEKLGIQHYLVEIGGEVRLKGLNAQQQPWAVAVEQPRSDTRAVERILHMNQASVATSGNYRNVFEYNGKQYSHIIDPRTGWPIEHHLASVTVVMPECMWADGWATALLALGPADGYALAERLRLPVLLINLESQGPVERSTAALQPYLAS